ncbi:MAG: hypothetical protein H6873_11850 [Hyphomicrobiaceae bacterium]|nr:hypothetical protein [Hyphomicrobiaceae bacterium]
MPPRVESLFRIIVWPLAGLTLALYLVMVLWSLPHLQALAGGQVVFDLRPAGYTYEQSVAIVTALGRDGADFYLGTQQFLDTIYPALMSLTLFVAIALLLPESINIGRLIVPWIAFAGAAFDYSENAAVREMLITGPQAIDPAIAAFASQSSILKATFTAIAMLLLIALLVRWGWLRLRGAGHN